MRERLYRAEEHDEEQLQMLENMIADIHQSSRIHHHSRRSQGRSPYVSTDRSKYGRSRSAPRPRDLAAGYSPRDPPSHYSARGRPNFVPGEQEQGIRQALDRRPILERIPRPPAGTARIAEKLSICRISYGNVQDVNYE
jgi:hypothetical protein